MAVTKCLKIMRVPRPLMISQPTSPLTYVCGFYDTTPLYFRLRKASSRAEHRRPRIYAKRCSDHLKFQARTDGFKMARQDGRRMIVRRAVRAGIVAKIGCHTFRATGSRCTCSNGGLLEYAQQMVAHESARTSQRPGDARSGRADYCIVSTSSLRH